MGVPGRTRALRILIVDDDALICEMLAEALGSLGHCICGSEGTEAGAVDAAARERPDLVIMDVELVPGCGVRAMERICCLGPVAHVFMSGRMRVATLLKPFRLAQLLLAMDRAMAQGAVPGVGS